MKALSKKFLVMGIIFLLVGSFGAVALAVEPEVIKITAKRFEYNPKEITLKKGVPVILEFTSLDRLHGFKCSGLGIRTDIEPGQVARVPVTAAKGGEF